MKRWYENKLDGLVLAAVWFVLCFVVAVLVGCIVINAQWETLDAYIAAHPNATIYIYN